MVAYTHLMEFLPLRESKISGSFMFLDGLIYVASPLIYVNITNDLDFFAAIALTLNVISLILFGIIMRGVPESLKWHICTGNI